MHSTGISSTTPEPPILVPAWATRRRGTSVEEVVNQATDAHKRHKLNTKVYETELYRLQTEMRQGPRVDPNDEPTSRRPVRRT